MLQFLVTLIFSCIATCTCSEVSSEKQLFLPSCSKYRKSNCFEAVPTYLFSGHTSEQLFILIARSSPIKNKTLPCDKQQQLAQVTIERLNSSNERIEQSTKVSVEVTWKSQTKNDLTSLGTMLCQGTYQQIANAVWRNKNLQKNIVKIFLKQIIKECDGLYSSKYPWKSPT